MTSLAWFNASGIALLIGTWRMRNGVGCHGLRGCWRQHAWIRGSRFYSVLREPHVENVEVTCGSSGYVTLNIHNPPKRTANTPLVIYIPSTFPPYAATTVKAPSIGKSLLSNYTVVQINPRWSSTSLFPTPIHDTLFAYSWIQKHLASPPSPDAPSPNTSPHSPQPNSPHHRQIAIYGTGLGGSLATSLALTECRPASREPSICALAVRDAVFDWSKIASGVLPLEAVGGEEARLFALREHLFRNPAAAFDAFASPLLFFRTCGTAIPKAWLKDAAVPSLDSGKADSSSSSPDVEALTNAPAPTRKAHLVFPPRKSGLRIPATRIGVTSAVKEDKDGLLQSQAKEMLKLMRRSVGLHEARERRMGLGLYGNGNEEWWDSQGEAEERVKLMELSSEDEGEWVSEFLEDVLGRN